MPITLSSFTSRFQGGAIAADPAYMPAEPRLMPTGLVEYWNGSYVGLQAGYAFTGDGDLFEESLIGTDPIGGTASFGPGFTAVFNAGGGFYSVENEFDDAFEGGV